MAIRVYGPTVVETAADSPDELAFLATIMANQCDDKAKLAYADWLEEKNDPRGPFLREFVDIAQDPIALLPDGDEFPFPWLQVIGFWHRQKIRSMIAQGCFLGQHVDYMEYELLSQARPMIHIIDVAAIDADLPPGCSKFGGLPDLVNPGSWPVSPDEYSNSTYIFCAQLRLSDLRGTLVEREFPGCGLLSFFHLPSGLQEGDRAVLHQQEASSFHRPDPPYDPAWDSGVHYDRDFFPLPSAAFRLIEGIDLPLSEEFGALPAEFLMEFSDDISELRRLPSLGYGSPSHQFLGYGDEPNAHPAPDRQPGVRRLATFSSPVDWGDSARPFWYLSAEDLAAGRFDRAGTYFG